MSTVNFGVGVDMTTCACVDCKRPPTRRWGGRPHCVACMPPMAVTSVEVAECIVDNDSTYTPMPGSKFDWISVTWFGTDYLAETREIMVKMIQKDVLKQGMYRDHPKVLERYTKPTVAES